MTKIILGSNVGFVVFFIIFTAVPAFSNDGKPISKKTLFGDKQRSFAVFAHDEHNEKADIDDCSVCHHRYRNGNRLEEESSEEMGCSDCHHVQPGYPTRPLMKAYHDLCKGCHHDNKVGPITCGECHPPG